MDKALKEISISTYINNIFFYSKLIIENFAGSLEEEKAKIEKTTEKETAIPYYYPYEKMVTDEYENTLYEPGLIFKNEEEKSKIERGVAWLLKKLGSNILSGQSVMNISLPVFLFDKRTMHEVFCYEHRGAPFYLSRAALATDSLERMKWVIVYVISQFYISTIQSKPFNPILGETFQCKIGDLNMYTEQTANHPITSNFYAFDDNHNYKIYGYIITTASTGANTITAIKTGKYHITFKDGTEYAIYLPTVLIKGITIGKRLFNYIQKLVVVDETNKKCGYVEFNPDQVGFLKSWFTSKQASFPDSFIGKVVNLEDVTISTKNSEHKVNDKAMSFLNIKGQWASHITFDEDEYWDKEDYSLLNINEVGYKCPSDGRNRLDLQALIKNDEETSQKEKEKLEVLQRADRKLRANYAKERQKK